MQCVSPQTNRAVSLHTSATEHAMFLAQSMRRHVYDAHMHNCMLDLFIVFFSNCNCLYLCNLLLKFKSSFYLSEFYFCKENFLRKVECSRHGITLNFVGGGGCVGSIILSLVFQ